MATSNDRLADQVDALTTRVGTLETRMDNRSWIKKRFSPNWRRSTGSS